jgi:hypothetical protein
VLVVRGDDLGMPCDAGPEDLRQHVQLTRSVLENVRASSEAVLPSVGHEAVARDLHRAARRSQPEVPPPILRQSGDLVMRQAVTAIVRHETRSRRPSWEILDESDVRRRPEAPIRALQQAEDP